MGMGMTLQGFCMGISRTTRSRQVRAPRRPPRACLLAGNAYVFSIRGPDPAPVLKKEAIPMALNICWLDDLAKAKDHARQTKKPILLDFFNPQ